MYSKARRTKNYILTTTSQATNWEFSALTTPIEIQPKEPKDFTLNVTLADTQGVENTITIKATSKADPNVVAKIKINMKVAPANTEQPIAKFHLSAKTWNAPATVKLDATESSG